jgi:hypothetical protein
MASNGSVKVARLGAYIAYTTEDGVDTPVAMVFADSSEKAVEINQTPGVKVAPVEEADTEDILRVGVVALVGLAGELCAMFRMMQQAAMAAQNAAEIDARRGPHRT